MLRETYESADQIKEDYHYAMSLHYITRNAGNAEESAMHLSRAITLEALYDKALFDDWLMSMMPHDC